MVSHQLSGAGVPLMKHMRHASWYADIPCYPRRNEIKVEKRQTENTNENECAEEKKNVNLRNDNVLTLVLVKQKPFRFFYPTRCAGSFYLHRVLFHITNKRHTALDEQFVQKRPASVGVLAPLNVHYFKLRLESECMRHVWVLWDNENKQHQEQKCENMLLSRLQGCDEWFLSILLCSWWTIAMAALRQQLLFICSIFCHLKT